MELRAIRRACALPALVGGLLVALASIAWAAPMISRSVVPFEDEPDCVEALPESVSLSGVSDDGRDVSLDVLVLADGVTKPRAREVMAKVATAYAPLDITVKTTVTKVAFMSDEMSDSPEPTADSSRLIEDARALLGGAPPSGFDLVYILTTKDIHDDGSDEGGHAACIGGIRYDDLSFAVGEDRFLPLNAGPLHLFGNVPAKHAAHEIAHLLGAHHHYANCAEGIPSELDQGEPSPCTVMFNDVGLASLNFSVLEGAVVRGHALKFAAP